MPTRMRPATAASQAAKLIGTTSSRPRGLAGRGPGDGSGVPTILLQARAEQSPQSRGSRHVSPRFKDQEHRREDNEDEENGGCPATFAISDEAWRWNSDGCGWNLGRFNFFHWLSSLFFGSPEASRANVPIQCGTLVQAFCQETTSQDLCCVGVRGQRLRPAFVLGGQHNPRLELRHPRTDSMHEPFVLCRH